MNDETINAHEDRIIDAVGVLKKNCVFFFESIAAFNDFDETYPPDAHLHDMKALELARFHISNIEEGVLRIAQTANDALKLIVTRPNLHEDEDFENFNPLIHTQQEEL